MGLIVFSHSLCAFSLIDDFREVLQWQDADLFFIL